MKKHLPSRSPTFTADAAPDLNVRLLVDDGLLSFALEYGNNSGGHATLPMGDRALQTAEALQFVADTISAEVPGRMSPFVRGWLNLAADINHNAREKGFWPPDPEDDLMVNDAEKIALMHAELSEALEGLRKGNPADAKLPEFTEAEVELADTVIRIMDLAHARGWRVAQAIEAKTKYNTTRPFKHGKEF